MRIGGKPYRTIWPAAEGRSVEVIDQTKLPFVFETRTLSTLEDTVIAIRSMVVRGAPLIGVTAAYGMAIALRQGASDAALAQAYDNLIAARPTAVNLRWALDEVRNSLRPLQPQERANAAWLLAARIADEDVETSRRIGEAGASADRGRPCARRQDRQHPHALQRRLAGDGRLGHGDRAHLHGA